MFLLSTQATCLVALCTGFIFSCVWLRLYISPTLQLAVCFLVRVFHWLHISHQCMIFHCTARLKLSASNFDHLIALFTFVINSPVRSAAVPLYNQMFFAPLYKRFQRFLYFANQKSTALHHPRTSNSLSLVRFGLRFPSSSRRASRISSRVRYSLTCDSFSFKSVLFPIGFLTA